MKQEDAGLAPPSIDDPDVRKELVLGLGLRKKQLEKLAKQEKEAGISSKPTDLRLRLHARGIVGHFSEDTEGTMFEATYPLKQVVDDPSIDPQILRDEGVAETVLSTWGADVGEGPLEDERWIDADGKLFQLGVRIIVSSSLAPREIKALDDVVAELAGDTPTDDIAEKRRQLAIAAVQDAGAMNVGTREKIVTYINHLTPGSPEFQEYVDAWLDDARSLDMKPIPPKDWVPPTPVEMTYEELLDDWLEGTGVKITPVAKTLLIEWEVPTQYLPAGKGVKIRKSEAEDANTRWINATRTQAEGDVQPTELVAVRLGKGKASHLILSDEEREKMPHTDYYVNHTMCGRDIGEGVELSGAQALDDCCKSCVKVHDANAKGFRLTWAQADDPA